MVQYKLDMGIELLCNLVKRCVAISCAAAEHIKKKNFDVNNGAAKIESQRLVLCYLRQYFPDITYKSKEKV